MAILDYRATPATFTLWLEADAIMDVADGGEVTAWNDLSGTGNNFARTGGAGTGPILTANQLNGRPGLYFDGVNDFLEGGILSTTMSAAVGTVIAVFQPTAFQTDSATIRNNDTIYGGKAQNTMGICLRSSTGINFWNHDAVNTWQYVVKSATLLHYYIAAWRHSTATLTGTRDDPFNPTSIGTSGATSSVAVNQMIGTSYNSTYFFKGYLFALMGIKMSVANVNLQAMVNYLAAKWFSPNIESDVCDIIRGDAWEQMRDVGSRRLWAFERPKLRAQIAVPPHFFDVDPLADIAISHPEWPEPDGLGAGITDYKRAYCRVVGGEIDLDTFETKLTVEDRHEMVFTYRDSLTGLRFLTPHAMGEMVLGAKAPRSFFRASKAWVEDPGDGRIVEIGCDQPKLTADGIILESAANNEFLRSSLISGTTGITLGGTGVGGSAIATTYGPPLLFDTAVTPQGLMFTAGNPHAADLTARWPDTVALTSYVRITVDHVDLDGTALYYRLQRLIDNKYWDEATGWVVAVTNNALSITASTSTIEQTNITTAAVGYIDVEAATILRFTLLLPTGGTASRRNVVYHVQCTSSTTASDLKKRSRIVTNTAVVSVAQDYHQIRETPPPQGTMLMAVAMQSCYRASTDQWIVALGQYPFNVEHYYRLGYTKLGMSWYWYFIGMGAAGGTGGVSSYIMGSWGDIFVALAARWIGPSGELGLTTNTVQLFVNGVNATGSASSGTPNMTNGLISFGGAGPVNGKIKLFRIIPRCLTDDEIAAWSAAVLAL